MNAFEILTKFYNYLRPFLDIALLTFVLYKAYEIILKTNALQIIKAVVIVGIAYGVVVLLNLVTMLWILNVLAPGLIVAFAIVFQPELRLLLLKIGQKEWFAFGSRSKHTYVDSVLIAAESLSKLKRGMLVVFIKHTKHDNIVDTGTRLNADLSSGLLVTIFGHDTPLHDGACIVQGGKLVAAGCFLPLSEQYDIKKTFGTRHRAALGMSEICDGAVLVVSEETGAISLAYDSKLYYDLSQDQLKKILESRLEITAQDQIIEDTIDEH
ncbi:MAG: diadenylate cyclase CdaA [Treponema sp.]|uniref:Diadenylate cyclase n=1 Tax=Treponema rectale TaxID=744512 RepID=A0A840SFI2_9SPIR|nr:diadenylate cyclase CdaA [Treponema rectale]MBB5218202.1 diadenylate cyclase [Treponema rectale]MBO6177405.1 diadenylate cyclase CdaA [Treponema sp.]QOS40094.1 TIGR00159 family protein [Treponema rectale]